MSMHMTKCRRTGQPIGFNPERAVCLCREDKDCCLMLPAVAAPDCTVTLTVNGKQVRC